MIDKLFTFRYEYLIAMMIISFVEFSYGLFTDKTKFILIGIYILVLNMAGLLFDTLADRRD